MRESGRVCGNFISALVSSFCTVFVRKGFRVVYNFLCAFHRTSSAHVSAFPTTCSTKCFLIFCSFFSAYVSPLPTRFFRQCFRVPHSFSANVSAISHFSLSISANSTRVFANVQHFLYNSTRNMEQTFFFRTSPPSLGRDILGLGTPGRPGAG